MNSVRRNASTMTATDPFFSDYAQAVEAMHSLPTSDQRNWRNQALVHMRHCTHGTLNLLIGMAGTFRSMSRYVAT